MRLRSIRIWAAMLALCFTVLLVSGCAGSPKAADSIAAEPVAPQAYYPGGEAMEEKSYTAEYNGYDAMPAEAPAPAPSVDMVDVGATAAGAVATQQNTPDYGGHKVIRTISVRFETDAFDADYQALLDRAATLGGYVESSSVEGRKPETYRDGGRYAYLTFRIPSDKVDAFAANAKTLGALLYYDENAEDITDRYFDSETRLDVLNVQLERLRSILTTSSELSDVIELEREIADVTLQIEELTSQLRRYDGLIGYSTVAVEIQELSLSAGPAREKTTGERISDGFTTTLYDLGTFFVDFAVWFVSALPILVILGVIALVIVLIIRSSIKKSRKRMAEAAAARQAQNQPVNTPRNPAPYPGDVDNETTNQGDKNND